MSSSAEQTAAQRRHPRVLKSPQDFAGGIFLLTLAAIGFFGTPDLAFGQMSNVGPAFMPRSIAVLVAAFGVLFVVQAFLTEGSPLERWSVRGPLFVLGAALLFGSTIRPLGLIVSGPLAVIVAALADRQSRPLEVAIYAVALTIFCGLLFKELLNLPIPFDPNGFIPDPLARAYLTVKREIAHVFAELASFFVQLIKR